jgi:hypothetical protein
MSDLHDRDFYPWPTEQSTLLRAGKFSSADIAYFDQCAVLKNYKLIRHYTDRRVRRWLMRRTGREVTGFGQILDEYLYKSLGVYDVPVRLADMPRAKV